MVQEGEDPVDLGVDGGVREQGLEPHELGAPLYIAVQGDEEHRTDAEAVVPLPRVSLQIVVLHVVVEVARLVFVIADADHGRHEMRYRAQRIEELVGVLGQRVAVGDDITHVHHQVELLVKVVTVDLDRLVAQGAHHLGVLVRLGAVVAVDGEADDAVGRVGGWLGAQDIDVAAGGVGAALVEVLGLGTQTGQLGPVPDHAAAEVVNVAADDGAQRLGRSVLDHRFGAGVAVPAHVDRTLGGRLQIGHHVRRDRAVDLVAVAVQLEQLGRAQVAVEEGDHGHVQRIVLAVLVGEEQYLIGSVGGIEREATLVVLGPADVQQLAIQVVVVVLAEIDRDGQAVPFAGHQLVVRVAGVAHADAAVGMDEPVAVVGVAVVGLVEAVPGADARNAHVHEDGEGVDPLGIGAVAVGRDVVETAVEAAHADVDRAVIRCGSGNGRVRADQVQRVTDRGQGQILRRVEVPQADQALGEGDFGRNRGGDDQGENQRADHDACLATLFHHATPCPTP